MNADRFDLLLNKIDILIKLTAHSVLKDEQQRDSIVFLTKVGIQPKDIAEILNTTSNTVSVTLSRLRKSGGL